MTDLTTMAKWYLDIGWSLLPILPETKTPAIKWTEFQERQPTLQEVEDWINKGWYLAVITGDVSGIAVIDDDRIKHGLAEWGFTSPIIAKTQNNGRHYYFKYDRELHSHSNGVIRVDLKAWHSYCLLPPFGGREWFSKPSRENLDKLTPIPDDIVRLINSDTKTESGQRTPVVLSDFLAIPEGNRNDALHRVACSLFNKHPEDVAIQILSGINATYNPPLTQTEFNYQVSRAKSLVKTIPGKVEPRGFRPRSLTEISEVRKMQRQYERVAPSTGYEEFDQHLKGFIPGHLYTLTGETNTGKTALVCNFASRVAELGKQVLYFALEPEENVVEYLASCRLDKRFDELTDDDISYDTGKIKVFTKADGINKVSDIALSLSIAERFDLVIIDHIGYFVHDNASYYIEQSNVIKELAGLASKNKCAIIQIAHPRKVKESSTLTMEDISGSASFKQDSDEVLILGRKKRTPEDPYSEYSNEGFVFIAKDKVGGSRGMIQLTFSPKKAIIKTQSDFYKKELVESTKPEYTNQQLETIFDGKVVV